MKSIELEGNLVPDEAFRERYKVQSRLRCEGGRLECAEERGSGARVAIRWLPPGLRQSPAPVLKKLPRHPALPQVREMGQVGERAYLATEFPEGRLLSTVREPLEPARVAELGAALVAALRALHGEGLVHGEISPDSVLVLEDGRAILWDVPIVLVERLADRRSGFRPPGALPRIARYLAPECARGQAPSEASDVHALASMLCQLAGAPGPNGETTLAVIHEVATGAWRPEIPTSLPEDVRWALEQMLAPDPAQRPAAKEVAHLFPVPRPKRRAPQAVNHSARTDPELPVIALANDDVAPPPAEPPDAADALAFAEPDGVFFTVTHAGERPAASPGEAITVQELPKVVVTNELAATTEAPRRRSASAALKTSVMPMPELAKLAASNRRQLVRLVLLGLALAVLAASTFMLALPKGGKSASERAAASELRPSS